MAPISNARFFLALVLSLPAYKLIVRHVEYFMFSSFTRSWLASAAAANQRCHFMIEPKRMCSLDESPFADMAHRVCLLDSGRVVMSSARLDWQRGRIV